jgi:hypothetical protein
LSCGERLHTSIRHDGIRDFNYGGGLSCGECLHTSIRHGNIRDLGRDELCWHPTDWLATRLAQISFLHLLPLKWRTHRRLVLKKSLLRLASLDEALRPWDARLDPKELLEQAKLPRKDARGVARPMELWPVALLFVEFGDKPVEVRFCVKGFEDLGGG